MSKALIITISPEGEVQIEAVGFVGAGCEELTRAVAEVLGVEIASESRKPAYFQGETEKVRDADRHR